MKECHEPDLHARQTSGAQSVEARAASASPCSSTLLYLLQVPLKSSRIPSLLCEPSAGPSSLTLRVCRKCFFTYPTLTYHHSRSNQRSREPSSTAGLPPQTPPVPSMDPHVRQNRMLLKCMGIRVFVSVPSCTGKSR